MWATWATRLSPSATTRAYRCYKAMHAHALDTGSGMSIIYALHRIGFAQITAGQWGQIRAHTEDALALARSIGQPALTVTPVAWLTWLAALQGDAAYTELRGRLVGLTNAHPLGILAGPVRDLALWAAGAHAAADGDHGQALHHLARIQVPALRRMTALDRIDAAVRAGETPRAELWIDETDQFCQLAGWVWPHAVAEYGRALLADKDPSADEHYRQALGVGPSSSGEGSHSSPGQAASIPPRARRPHARSSVARVQLAYGQWLRRRQQRIEARSLLRRAALETFADLEASAWATKADEELRASGESARKRNPSTLLQLTPMDARSPTSSRRACPTRASPHSAGSPRARSRSTCATCSRRPGSPPAANSPSSSPPPAQRRPTRLDVRADPGHQTGATHARLRPQSTRPPIERPSHEPPHTTPKTAATPSSDRSSNAPSTAPCPPDTAVCSRTPLTLRRLSMPSPAS